jgi:2-polyprenyl-3-methyl-5-hydroxy-6-metoxy-1,4-benzoquinol methylase
MACLICASKNAQEIVAAYDGPDQYEAYMGLNHAQREWWRCGKCGHYHQTRNYDLWLLEKIYENGYREPKFRGKTIDQAFDEIVSIPWRDSENKQRSEWFSTFTAHETVLDIGAGIGVFPVLLKDFGYDVECVETNRISREFLATKGIKCYSEIPVDRSYWAVSLVHVLEHIAEPDDFLKAVKKVCRRHLFVEVPDAREFAYLPKEHDEFNSCHVWFFTLQNLITLIERNGFEVAEVSRKFYPKRKLSRILVLATI